MLRGLLLLGPLNHTQSFKEVHNCRPHMYDYTLLKIRITPKLGCTLDSRFAIINHLYYQYDTLLKELTKYINIIGSLRCFEWMHLCKVCTSSFSLLVLINLTNIIMRLMISIIWSISLLSHQYNINIMNQ